jgi:hypothetical protein
VCLLHSRLEDLWCDAHPHSRRRLRRSYPRGSR